RREGRRFDAVVVGAFDLVAIAAVAVAATAAAAAARLVAIGVGLELVAVRAGVGDRRRDRLHDLLLHDFLLAVGVSGRDGDGGRTGCLDDAELFLPCLYVVALGGLGMLSTCDTCSKCD